MQWSSMAANITKWETSRHYDSPRTQYHHISSLVKEKKIIPDLIRSFSSTYQDAENKEGKRQLLKQCHVKSRLGQTLQDKLSGFFGYRERKEMKRTLKRLQAKKRERETIELRRFKRFFNQLQCVVWISIQTVV